jgi:hypothetical protein
MFLEPVCKIREQENGSKEDHSRKVDGPLFVASGNATELLEPVDESLYQITFSVNALVKRAFVLLILASRDGMANIAGVKILPKRLTGIAFICNETLWVQPNMSVMPANVPLLHQGGFGMGNITLLTRC